MKPLLLMILDGFGINSESDGNAIKNANTPNLDRLFSEYPYTKIEASGQHVGLPVGQMGNSEVGHLNIGGGRIVYQEISRIDKNIKGGDFFENPVFLGAIDHVKKHNSNLHLIGLVSDGNVHSSETHYFALLKLCANYNLKNVCFHALLDGRDTPPRSALKYIRHLENKMDEYGAGRIVTVGGRYYGMDRDKRWERIEKAYRAMVYGEGITAANAEQAVQQSYAKDEADEFVLPTVILDSEGNPKGLLQENDAIVFYNFRADRVRQMNHVLQDEEFPHFERTKFNNLYVVNMTEYEKELPSKVAFPKVVLKNTLGEIVSGASKRQLRIAETEKYAHVTFFFNGAQEKEYDGENRILVPSPKVATYDLQPEMSVYEVRDKVIEEISKDKYDLIILNFANPDMVGHTGIFDAAVSAIKAVDECAGRVVNAVLERNGSVLITADHGNAEQMLDPSTGQPHTAHTTNKVPFALVSAEYKEANLRDNGKLADIAPTILYMMGIEKPADMDGINLIV